jgi:hypothetical protein
MTKGGTTLPWKVVARRNAFFCPFLTEVSSRPERSAVEGPAVQRTSRGNVFRSEESWACGPPQLLKKTVSLARSKQKCHPDRSEAQWRDLLFIIRNIESEWKRRPPLCHPDRSVAQWRDLQFYGPLLEMFSTPQPYAASSIAFHSAPESCTFAAAIFSSRCFTEEVPGIGINTGE